MGRAWLTGPAWYAGNCTTKDQRYTNAEPGPWMERRPGLPLSYDDLHVSVALRALQQLAAEARRADRLARGEQ